MLILLVYLQQHSFQNLILLLRHSYLEYSKFTTTHFFNKLYNIYIWVAPLTSSRCSYLGLRTPLRQRSAWPAPPEWFRSAVRPSGPRRAGQTVACCSVPSLRQLHPSGRWRPGCSRSTSAPHPTSQSPPWRWKSCSMKRQLFDDLHSRRKRIEVLMLLIHLNWHTHSRKSFTIFLFNFTVDRDHLSHKILFLNNSSKFYASKTCFNGYIYYSK